MSKSPQRYLYHPGAPAARPLSVRETVSLFDKGHLPPELDHAIKNIRSALHELAQPLAVITGTIDLLMLELDQHSELFQDVKNISDQLEHILHIVDDIRSVARQITPNPMPAAEA